MRNYYYNYVRTITVKKNMVKKQTANLYKSLQ